jgi:alkylhydroperoxidase/carboxymuconolactone decarboxylase family protein YurZ
MSGPESSELPPSGAGQFARSFPEVWDAYAALGKSAAEAGPLEADTRRLIKLALAMGAGSEGAVHSHTRQALAEGQSVCSPSPRWDSRPQSRPCRGLPT